MSTDYAARLFGEQGSTETPESDPESDYASRLLGESKAEGPRIVGPDEIKGSVFANGIRDDNAGFLERQRRSAGAGLGFFLNNDEKARADIIRKHMPDAEFAQDADGRIVVRGAPDEPFRYINKLGIDAQDVVDFAGDVLKFAPAAKAAGLGRGLLSRMAIGAGAAGATSAASDALSGGLGSEQGVDVGKAAISAAGGAGGELLSLPYSAGKSFLRQVRGQSGEEASEALVRNFDQATAKGARADPANAVAVDNLARTEFGIPLTRGQATGNVAQQAFESSALRGGRGTSAQQTLERFMTSQRDALRGTGDAIASPGGRLTSGVNQSGAIIRDGVKSRAASLNQRVDIAYEAARAHNARLTAGAMPELVDSISRGAPEEFRHLIDIDPRSAARSYPQATTAYRATERLMNGLGARRGGEVVAVDFRRIESHRKLLNALAKDANPADARAVWMMRSAMDGWLDSAVTRNLFEGDEAFLKAFKEARELRNSYGKLFEKGGAKDFAGRAIDDIIKNDPTPEETINLLFGASSIGVRRGSAETVRQIRTIAGRESDEFISLREAAVDRIMSRGFGRSGDQLRIGTLVESWDQALNGTGRSVMEEMFDPTEIARMRRYMAVLKRIEPKPGAVNHSNSTIEAMRQGREILGSFVRLPQLASSRALSGAADPSALSAKLATKGAPRALERPPSPAVSTVPALNNVRENEAPHAERKK